MSRVSRPACSVDAGGILLIRTAAPTTAAAPPATRAPMEAETFLPSAPSAIATPAPMIARNVIRLVERKSTTVRLAANPEGTPRR